MRTIVYIDGFNLFYSLLTKSPYKWLDLVRLFEEQLLQNVLLSGAEEQAQFELVSLKYFTAPILGKLAKDPDSPDRQAHYHRALKAGNGGRFQLIKGFSSFWNYHRKPGRTEPGIGPNKSQSDGREAGRCEYQSANVPGCSQKKL